MREGLYLLFAIRYKKTIRSHEAEAINLGADFYDHIHDHRHDWSTRRQDATRARKVIFAVAEMSKKRQNDQKNVQVAVGVVEAASSSLVTQTKKRDSQESRFFFILQGFLALFDF